MQKITPLFLILFLFVQLIQLIDNFSVLNEYIFKFLPLTPQLPITVKKINMATGYQQLLVIMLRCDVYQTQRQLSCKPGRHETIINIKTAAAVFRNYPPDNAAIFIFNILLNEQFLYFGLFAANSEICFYNSTIPVIANP